MFKSLGSLIPTAPDRTTRLKPFIGPVIADRFHVSVEAEGQTITAPEETFVPSDF